MSDLPTLLLADDEEPMRMFIVGLLKHEACKVVAVASDGKEAWELYQKHKPDITLLDINMPGKSGLDFVQLLRKSNIDVPVVFISAFKKYAIHAIRLGVYSFIAKPFDKEELSYVIEKYRLKNNKDLYGKLMDVVHSIKEEPKITVNSWNNKILLDPNEIIYFNSDNGCTDIYLKNGKKEVANNSLSQIELKVKGGNFSRLGRSALINQKYIRSIDKTTNICLLKYNDKTWEVSANSKSIRKILTENFSYV